MVNYEVVFILVSVEFLSCDKIHKLFIDWRKSLLNEGQVILTNEHYSVSLDCSSTIAGQRLLSSRIFENINIAWLLDNYFPLYSGADGRKVVYDVGKFRKSLLRINEMSHGDAGLYTCNLDKGREMKNRYRTISYFVLLTTNPPIFHVYIGDRFKISCPLDIIYQTLLFAEADFTKWSIKWLLNNNTIREGQIMNNSNLQYTVIKQVGVSHEGIWQCQMERIGHFENNENRRVYLLKRFIINVHKLPSFLVRMPAFELLRVITPLLGFILSLMLCFHLIMAVILFDKFAEIETKFQVWQVINKFSKKNYMKFYLKQLKTEEQELLEKERSEEQSSDS